MTLVWFEGFEALGNDDDLRRVYDQAFGRWPILVPGLGRGGGIGLAAGTSQSGIITPTFAADSTVIVGFALQIDRPETRSNQFLLQVRSNSDICCSIEAYVQSPGSRDYRFQIRDANGAILDSTLLTGQANAGVWHYYELKVTVDEALGAIELRQDETVVTSLTKIDTQGNGAGTANQVVFGGHRDNLPADRWTFDDIYICNGAGSSHNDYLGDHRVVALLPVANGAFADFFPNLAQENYESVDDAPTQPQPGIGDNNTGVANSLESYQLEDLPGEVVAIEAVRSLLLVENEDIGSEFGLTVSQWLLWGMDPGFLASDTQTALTPTVLVTPPSTFDPYTLLPYTVQRINDADLLLTTNGSDGVLIRVARVTVEVLYRPPSVLLAAQVDVSTGLDMAVDADRSVTARVAAASSLSARADLARPVSAGLLASVAASTGLARLQPLAALLEVVADLSANVLSGTPVPIAASLASTSVVGAAVAARRGLTAQILTQFGLDVSVDVDRSVAARLEVQGDASARLDASRSVLAVLGVSVDLVGDAALERRLSGSIASTLALVAGTAREVGLAAALQVAASLDLTRLVLESRLAATLLARVGVEIDVTTDVLIAASVQALTDIRVAASRNRGVGGAIASSASVGVHAEVERSIEAQLGVVADLAARLVCESPIAAELQAHVTFGAIDVARRAKLASTVGASTSLSGSMQLETVVAAALEAEAEFGVAASTDRPLAGDLSTLVSLLLALSADRPARSSAVATTSSITGNVVTRRGLSADLQSSVAANARVGVVRTLGASIRASSSLSVGFDREVGLAAPVDTWSIDSPASWGLEDDAPRWSPVVRSSWGPRDTDPVWSVQLSATWSIP